MSTSTTQLRTATGDDAFSIGISPTEALGAAGGSSDDSKQLSRWLFASGLVTLAMDVGTAFYRSPHGVVFEKHRFAYYATLSGIFAAGLAEVAIACWLVVSCSSGHQQVRVRSRACSVAAVCISVVPLVAIIALGGFSVVMKG